MDKENAGFTGFAIFTINGHLGFLIKFNFTILKPLSLIMLHVKFEILWIQWCKRLSHLNGLKC